MNPAWQERARPARLERRYQFTTYNALRDFLDEAATISEREGLYPDIGFSRDYVNMTIHADEHSQSLVPHQHRVAQLIEALYPSVAAIEEPSAPPTMAGMDPRSGTSATH